MVDNAPLSAPLDPLALQAQLGDVPLQLLRGEEGWASQRVATPLLQPCSGRGIGVAWLLNPDTRLPEPDAVAQVHEALQVLEPRTLVGTAVRDEEGALEPSGGWLDSGLRLAATADASARHCRGSGAGGLAQRLQLLLQRHEPPARFDPAYSLYYEDMDLCCRLAAAGAPVLWLPQLEVLHQRGKAAVHLQLGGCSSPPAAIAVFCSALRSLGAAVAPGTLVVWGSAAGTAAAAAGLGGVAWFQGC